ncbi:hypothetical protein OQA88_5266 [Cercophora sp. LCS_1]
MASNLHVHKPYLLKALSKPLGHLDGSGSYTVGDVFGQSKGSKRRRRPEVSVAIDGEAVHIYDVVSAQALTSYLVPPQSSFSCPAYSLRWRSSAAGNATRYTYISTLDWRSTKKGNEIKLFRDVLAESGTTTTTTSTHSHRGDKPIVYLAATSSGSAIQSVQDLDAPGHDLIAVAADGTLLCLHGETLECKWQSSPTVFTQELSSKSTVEGFQVEFVQSLQAADIVDGMFEGKNDLFGVFQEKVHREGFNPDVLVTITSLQKSPEVRQRHIHILALSQERSSRQTNGQKTASIIVAPLPNKSPVAKYQLDTKAGALQVQSGDTILTYSLKQGVPRLDGELQVSGLTSFVRLSKTSVLTATTTSLSVYNPVYRSLQATTSLESEKPESSTGLDLAVYFGGREMVVGLQNSSLVAIQIEAPSSRSTKRRAEGLLIDAIRRGIPRQKPRPKHSQTAPAQTTILAEAHPGVASEAGWVKWQEDSFRADKLLGSQDLQGFEEFMAEVFQVQVKDTQSKEEPKTNGEHVEEGSDADEPAAAGRWNWLSAAEEYSRVDRRWVIYAISKVFSWDSAKSASDGPRMQCHLPDSNVLGYLIGAGHLTVSNIKSAFREQILDVDEVDKVIGEEFPVLLAEVDPTLELLLAYLAATQLGAIELTCALKLLLRSLDLLEDPSKMQKLKDVSEQEVDGDNDVIKMELDRAEEELQVTEYYLGSDSSSRAQGLSVAFSKLAMCPATPTIQSLRRLFKPDEIICLMNVLRMELIKDGWTTRYLDGSIDDEEEESDAAPDGSIRVIAELMCRCVDSVGLGGWIAFDAMLAHGSDQHQDEVDFFSQFQDEVSVALEGVREAVRLQGTLAEVVGYATRAKAAMSASHLSKGSLVGTKALPFGLKTESKTSLTRIRGGGEIVQRSMRQIGHFHSKKRKAYSVTRITEENLLGQVTNKVYKEEQEEL